jgi:ATP-dependent Lhr-like helicase
MTSESKSAAAIKWFSKQGWNPFPFQLESWDAYLDGQNGIVNAPTGSGKTLSLIVPILLEGLHSTSQNKGKLQALWISPIRALTKEIKFATEEAIKGLGLDWRVGIRSGDTSTTERQKQKENPPEILITTPESIHVLLSSQGYISFFENLKAVVVDEWHELMGNKRGVQTCLAISRFLKIAPEIRIWAISATIANLDEAADVLLGAKVKEGYIIVKSEVEKRISVESINGY